MGRRKSTGGVAVTWTQRGRVDIARSLEDISVYAGEPGDKAEVPEDVAELLAELGYATSGDVKPAAGEGAGEGEAGEGAGESAAGE